MPLAASDMQDRLVDPAAWQIVLNTARVIERVPELLGLSPHLIATAADHPMSSPADRFSCGTRRVASHGATRGSLHT